MARYGAIYIAHHPRDGEDTYKVGLTTCSVTERMEELTGEACGTDRYQSLGHVVVSDVDEAEQACHSLLAPHHVQDGRDLFAAELNAVVVAVRDACGFYAVADALPLIDDPSSPEDADDLFSETGAVADKETNSDEPSTTERKNARATTDNPPETGITFEDAISVLSKDCARLADTVKARSDRIGIDVFPWIDSIKSDDLASRRHTVCEVRLSGPVEPPLWHGIRCTPMTLRTRTPEDGSEWQHAVDDGIYGILNLAVEISEPDTLIFRIEGKSPLFDALSMGGVFSRKLIAKQAARAYFLDLDKTRSVFDRFVAANISNLPDTVRRGFYTESTDRRGGMFSERSYHDYWANKADCELDVSPLGPHLARPDCLKSRPSLRI